ncbi:hypothetical protein JYU34_009653 [Plutella xylostella]|uniref:Uncharacterized protein n=1 Tax=Plutella xylostella TaxID=51655 RepID=A0ABQ7QKJ7_PLUXY|nr:hypothetical protein JYU34_009653 [Plutella xylostella]
MPLLGRLQGLPVPGSGGPPVQSGGVWLVFNVSVSRRIDWLPTTAAHEGMSGPRRVLFCARQGAGFGPMREPSLPGLLLQGQPAPGSGGPPVQQAASCWLSSSQ